MRTITARPGYHRIVCSADDDVTIILPSSPRTGGLDVVVQGRKVVVQNGDLSGWRINVSGFGPRVDLIGLRSDASQGAPRDIVNIAGKFAVFVIDKCRLVGVHGRADTIHGDCVQVLDGASVGLLMIRRSTLASCYQAVMAKLCADGCGVRRIIFDTVNIRDNAAQREQQSVAVLLMGCAETEGRVEVRNSYLEWPKGDTHAMATAGRVTRIGAFLIGNPPGGDFCPA